MRILSLVLLASLAPGLAAAQVASGPAAAPGVEVTKSAWRREMRIPALDEDPLLAHQQQREMERTQKVVAHENKVRARLGLEQLPPPTGGVVRRSDGGPYVEYVYEIKINNTGAKPIRAVEWEYVLTDPATGSEAGRNRFLHEADVRPGKSKSLVARTPSPPARVVDVSKSDKLTRGQFSEQVVILRIVYEDGTLWERPAN